MPRQQFNLAARLEKQATNVENDGHLNAARYMRDAAAALRAAATPSAQGASLLPDASPGNGAEKVREALAPFAKIADEYDDREDDGFPIWKDCDQSQTRVTLGMCRSARAALHSTSAAGETTSSDKVLDFREFKEDEFRSMEVQICSETKTVQFCVSDHGGDHPTSPAVAISWVDAVSLITWVRDSIIPSEAIPADVLAMKEACKRAVSECLNQYGRMTFVAEKGWSGLEGQIAAAIDKLSPEVTAEGGRGEPVAIKPLEWDGSKAKCAFGIYSIGRIGNEWTLEFGRTYYDRFTALKTDVAPTFETALDAAKAAAQADYERRIRSVLVVHPASPPDVEAIRAGEREKCATEVERRNYPTVGDARTIASAIRTGGQKK